MLADLGCRYVILGHSERRSRHGETDHLIARKVAAAQDLTPAGYTTRATAGLPPPAYTSEVLRRGGDAAYRANNLPASHNVNPEYQNSGRWLGDPQ